MRVFSIVLLFAVLCQHALVSDARTLSSGLRHVASADGKRFYADDDIPRDWFGAGAHCKENGMRLAAIQSRVQAEALQAAYSNETFWGYHWTAGRESRVMQEFRWNQTEEEVSSDYLNLLHWELPYQTCLLYRSEPNNASFVTYEPCTTGVRTLCEEQDQ